MSSTDAKNLIMAQVGKTMRLSDALDICDVVEAEASRREADATLRAATQVVQLGNEMTQSSLKGRRRAESIKDTTPATDECGCASNGLDECFLCGGQKQ